MSKKRGLSLEEKRTKLIAFFNEKKEPFQLKELEKLVPSVIPMPSQSVKDVVKTLCDDDYIETDKIGLSIYFWSFPSKSGIIKQNKLKKLKDEFLNYENSIFKIKKEIEVSKVDKEDTEERNKLWDIQNNLREELKKIKEELIKYKENDPETIKEVQTATSSEIEKINSYTDNIYSLKSWMKKKFPIDEKDLDKQFEIPEDFDYYQD